MSNISKSMNTIKYIQSKITKPFLKFRMRKLSFKEHRYLCQLSVMDIDASRTMDVGIVGTSTETLFRTYNLHMTLSNRLIFVCSVATSVGWILADYVLKVFAITGDAWSEEKFDDIMMPTFLNVMKREFSFLEDNELSALYWSFHQGERLRVMYHTLPEFLRSYSRGELYGTCIKLNTCNNE